MQKIKTIARIDRKHRGICFFSPAAHPAAVIPELWLCFTLTAYMEIRQRHTTLIFLF
jgi:hypothetical protein